MTQDEFNQALLEFDQDEPMRAQLYYRALNLIRAGFVIEAHLLILATWNFARFRYATRDFDLRSYQQDLDRLAELLHPLNGCELMAIDLPTHQDSIVESFGILSAIEGIEYTGASKILHLLYPSVFVMWDRFISGLYPKRSYLPLDIVQSDFWPYRRYASSGNGYYDFLVFCQQRFRDYTSPDPRKTLAKCIDEFNFTKITYPIKSSLKAARAAT